jgi:2-iminobutanoate/2-iminopropanoate deaminase
MPIRNINPVSMGGPPASYTNGMSVTAPQEFLFVAGQAGIDASGKASSDFEAQARQAWANVTAVLAESGMSIANVVKTTIFLVDPADFPVFAVVRKSVLRDHKPTSTLVYVSALFNPAWKVEIEAIAVK